MVVLYGLGGTIASRYDGDGRLRPDLDIAKIAGAVPGLRRVVDLELQGFRDGPSVELTFADLTELVRRLRDDVERGVDGFVVAQGTDTLEEAAFALDLLWDLDAPIVVTGSMRAPEAVSSDSASNLVSAALVAGNPAARGLGCLVVMNEEIYTARHVQKGHTTSLAAFDARPVGAIGAISEGRVEVWMRPTERRQVPLERLGREEQPVALVRLTIDDDGRCIDELVRLGYKGVVVEGLGGGHVPKRLVDTLAALASEVPVVLSSRTGSGRVLESTYGFPGSETDLLARGLIPAGSLDGLKARVQLALLLRAGATREELRVAFS